MARFLSAVIVGAIGCWLFCGTLSRPATADVSEDTKKNGPLKIAVVDMSRVFNSSKFFHNEREGLKTKFAEIQETGQKLAKEIQDLSQKWKKLEAGSEERKELETRLKRKQTEFAEYQRTAQQKFLKDQAELFLATYRKATPEIADYAQAHNIDLVIQNQPEPVDEGDPIKLIQSLNRSVLYENKLDITDEIISAMAEQ